MERTGNQLILPTTMNIFPRSPGFVNVPDFENDIEIRKT
jgi:hypothetical protein